MPRMKPSQIAGADVRRQRLRRLSALHAPTLPRSPLLRLLLPLALAGMLAGCLSRPGLERHTFALESPPPAGNLPATNQAVLAIRLLEVSPLFEGRSFVYRTGPDRYQADPYAGFLIAPARALAIPLRGYFRNSGAFKDVMEPGSQLGANTFLEVYVTELYGDFRPSSRPAAVLSMRMLFFDPEGLNKHHPFLNKEWSRRVPLQKKTAAALVGGWNQALAQTMAEVTSELVKIQSAHEKTAAAVFYWESGKK